MDECLTCRWFDPVPEDKTAMVSTGAYGTCRRFPPVPVINARQSLWAQVHETDVCGEYEPAQRDRDPGCDRCSHADVRPDDLAVAFCGWCGRRL